MPTGRLTPSNGSAKWEKNASAAVTSYKTGVQATVGNPLQLASAATTLWAQNTIAAKTKFRAATANYPEAKWKTLTVNKGGTNYPVGIRNGLTNYKEAASKLYPFITSVRSSLPSRGTLQRNIQRATAMIEGMAKYTKTTGSAR